MGKVKIQVKATVLTTQTTTPGAQIHTSPKWQRKSPYYFFQALPLRGLAWPAHKTKLYSMACRQPSSSSLCDPAPLAALPRTHPFLHREGSFPRGLLLAPGLALSCLLLQTSVFHLHCVLHRTLTHRSISVHPLTGHFAHSKH